MSIIKTNQVQDLNGNPMIAVADGVASGSFAPVGMRNRIINGAMVIDQRNAGASVTPASGSYTLDRWKFFVTQTSKLTCQQNAGSVTPPVGFGKYLGVTSSSAYSVGSTDYFCLNQPIEGFNTFDLAWGTANAIPVTLSFWVRSSLTGTFGGALNNGDFSRSYPFSYTIASASTWTPISVTIAGDTTGTWVGATNGIGLNVTFGLGSGSTNSGTSGSWASGFLVQPTSSVSVVGTNGATFYITGVQLEKGTVATPFEYRQYGTELALCQRYYYQIKPGAVSKTLAIGFSASTTVANGALWFPVEMRDIPTSLDQSGTANQYAIVGGAGGTAVCSSVPIISANLTTTRTGGVAFTVASGLTSNLGYTLRTDATNGANAYLGWSAEL